MQSSALGRSNNRHPHGLGKDWPSNCPVKKELGVTGLPSSVGVSSVLSLQTQTAQQAVTGTVWPAGRGESII